MEKLPQANAPTKFKRWLDSIRNSEVARLWRTTTGKLAAGSLLVVSAVVMNAYGYAATLATAIDAFLKSIDDPKFIIPIILFSCFFLWRAVHAVRHQDEEQEKRHRVYAENLLKPVLEMNSAMLTQISALDNLGRARLQLDRLGSMDKQITERVKLCFSNASNLSIDKRKVGMSIMDEIAHSIQSFDNIYSMTGKDTSRYVALLSSGPSISRKKFATTDVYPLGGDLFGIDDSIERWCAELHAIEEITKNYERIQREIVERIQTRVKEIAKSST
jgi:hypothetical protein